MKSITYKALKQDYLKKIESYAMSQDTFKCFVLNALCSKAKQLRIVLTLNDAGGGQNDPLVTDKACMPSIFIKTPQIFF